MIMELLLDLESWQGHGMDLDGREELRLLQPACTAEDDWLAKRIDRDYGWERGKLHTLEKAGDPNNKT